MQIQKALRWIWQVKNEEYHRCKFVSAQYLLDQVQSSYMEFLAVQPTSSLPPRSVGFPAKWVKPQVSFLKLNVDGAIDDERGVRGLDVVLRNELGNVLLAVSKELQGRFNPKVTEIYAAALGLQVIYNSGFYSFSYNYEV
ncbi:uncharacterized protein LOC133730375 [Rosa rugosa]|uniref:uncharacterized protein LOC133730375 n=1 Tax=Rosa rugosa TaxID=74645 RepID=UPI002B405FBB|nr:uncharacterized protein LOC133730375 [Rosa rugosa]